MYMYSIGGAIISDRQCISLSRPFQNSLFFFFFFLKKILLFSRYLSIGNPYGINKYVMSKKKKILKYTHHGEDFVLHQDNDMIIFTPKSNLSVPQESEH